MGSTVVHLRRTDPEPAMLALVAGLAVRDAICQSMSLSTEPVLKWPNDLLIGIAKLGGILLERNSDSVVVGVGVNLKVAPVIDGRETIALSALGTAPERDAFAQVLSATFDAELARWRDAGTAQVIRRWSAAAHPPGTKLVVTGADGKGLEGTFVGLDDAGAMQLRLGDGRVETILSGEVLLADTKG